MPGESSEVSQVSLLGSEAASSPAALDMSCPGCPDDCVQVNAAEPKSGGNEELPWEIRPVT